MALDLTVVIVARNEASELAICLKSLRSLPAPVVVIDLSSSDDTASVAKKFGAKVVKHAPVAIVEEVRQSSLKYVATTYALFLDPDEELSTSFVKEIPELINSGSYDYFVIPRQNIVFGKWIKHSHWWPDYQVRIFKKTRINWPKVLHAQPQITGEGITLEPTEVNSIIHHNYSSIDEWIDKNRRYAQKNAEELIKSGDNLTLAETITKSVGQIISRFFQGEGYKDGLHGLMLSFLQAIYYFHVYLYYWEYKKFAELEDAKTVRAFPADYFKYGTSQIMYWQAKGKPSLKDKVLRRLL